ncbi:MFS transporter [Arthrobacter cupressi]|uniref:Major Facilitator Superfamily protein n=1 Tax=Arthrobacter cupressi TaxID=1045773 RepID=A0A1G8NFK3_9MICC|nr:MFS transporter [Arthrobacter cupressi]NYD78270.1 MFS family permease [Arthrobacter cupressi]SDI78300.1 Major Facilitator Superfamily protein [Arthrobacter cupressi]
MASKAMPPRTMQPAAAALTRRTIIGMILAMALVESLSGVTQGYLNPILPALGPVFAIDDPAINGIFLISNVSFAVLTPIISRLGDSYGYRLVLRWSTAVVALGAFTMAFWPSLWTVTVGVVLLTCVVGFIPLMMGILRVSSPAHTRTGVSVMIGVLMITFGAGGLLAGIIGASQPTVGLWVAVPFAVAALVASFVLPDAGTPTREGLAMVPLMACSLGLIGFVVALSMGPEWGWLDARTLLAGVLGLGLLAVWARIDSRLPGAAGNARRFMDLRMLAKPRIRAVSLATFFFGFASISYFGTNGIFLHANPEKAGYGFALSSFNIAVILALGSVLSLVSSLLTARVLRSFGERATLVSAGVLLAAGFAIMALAHGSLSGYCAGFALFNLSLGMYQAGTRALSVEGVPLEETSTAAGLNELALSVGIAVGAAVVKLISSSTADGGRISEGGLFAIWGALAVAALIASAASARYPKRVTAEVPA